MLKLTCLTVSSRLFYWCYCLILSLLVGSCVAVQEPEGGPPDETPPKLVRSFPEDGAVHFKGKKISLTFNKDISVAHLDQKMVVMPQLDKSKNKRPYLYKINGKTLAIKLNVPLNKDTTYSIHLNDAVKDTHEGTKISDLVLTFSTGSFIDAIMAKGSVKALLTNKSVGDVRIYLYSADRDPKEWQEKGIPDYYTVSDKEGNFTIDHIRLGKYYIRATTGKDRKYKIDYENDHYGFLKDPIDLNDSQMDIMLPLVKADIRDLKLLYTLPKKGVCEIVLNKAVTKYQLVAFQTIGTKGKPQLYSFFSEKSPKVISLYNTLHLLEGETFKVRLMVQDALDMVLEENVEISFKEGKADISTRGLSHSLLPRSLASVLPLFTETIFFNKPIQLVQEDLIYFECKDQKKILVNKDELEWSSDRTKLMIKKNFTKEMLMDFVSEGLESNDKSKIIKRTVILQIEAGACTAFDKTKNKKINLRYPLRNEAETATISGNIETTATDFIIELLNSKDAVVDSVRNVKAYLFKMIPAGAYRVRILVLNKGAEKWSPGDIHKNIEPNPVIFYEKEITVVEKLDVIGIDFKF